MIELRILTDSDIKAHNRGEDAETVRWFTGDYGTFASTKRHFSELAENAAQGKGKRGFGVWASGRLAGYVDCDPTLADLPASRDVNIAYAVHPWARRRGVATAAVELICQFIVDEQIGDRAIARIEAGNDASIGVVENCGFKFVGMMPSSSENIEIPNSKLVFARELRA